MRPYVKIELAGRHFNIHIYNIAKETESQFIKNIKM